MTTTQVSPLVGQDWQTFFSNDGKSLYEFRERAYKEYQELPEPHFERSDFANRLYDFSFAPVKPPQDWRDDVEAIVDLAGEQPVLVFVDGHLEYTHGLNLIPAGVTVKSLRSAADDEAVIQRLGSVIPVAENKWTALQSACWQDGLYLHIARNTSFSGVIQVVHLTTQKGRGSFPRSLVVAEEGSQVSVLDLHLARPEVEEELHFGVTEIIAAADSRVSFGSIQDFPKHTTNYWLQRANVDQNARVDFVVGEMGDGYTVGEFGSSLLGAGSVSTGHAVVLGTGKAHLDLTAKMVHIGKFSESDTSTRGVMLGKADAICRGVTHIQKGASGANGEQTEKLLMLSPKSRADAIPILLIDENDVKCGHAASVGQISEEQLFYLMSRGISKADAKRMIVWGFLDPVLAALPVERVRNAVETILERKMN